MTDRILVLDELTIMREHLERVRAIARFLSPTAP